MGQLDVTKFGLSTGITFGVLSLACGLLILIGGTSITLFLSNNIFHGLDVSSIMKTTSISEILIGTVSTFIIGLLAGIVLSSAYNFMTKVSEETNGSVFTCSMHSEVRKTAPGKCPKCGMKLIQVK